MKLGSNDVDSLKVGASSVGSVYLGETRVWPTSFDPLTGWSVQPVHAFWPEDPDWVSPGTGNLVTNLRNAGSIGGNLATASGAEPTLTTSASYGGRLVLSFGSNDYLKVDPATNVAQPWYVVAVGALPGVTANRTMVSAGLSLSGVGHDNTARTTFSAGTSLTTPVMTAPLAPHLFVGKASGSSSELEIDGVLVAAGSAGSGVLDAITLGASGFTSPTNFLNSTLALVLFFDTDPRLLPEWGDFTSWVQSHYGFFRFSSDDALSATSLAALAGGATTLTTGTITIPGDGILVVTKGSTNSVGLTGNPTLTGITCPIAGGAWSRVDQIGSVDTRTAMFWTPVSASSGTVTGGFSTAAGGTRNHMHVVYVAGARSVARQAATASASTGATFTPTTTFARAASADGISICAYTGSSGAAVAPIAGTYVELSETGSDRIHQVQSFSVPGNTSVFRSWSTPTAPAYSIISVEFTK